MTERLLTIDQTAERLAVSRSTMYRLIRRRELPIVEVAGRKRVPESAIARLVAQAEDKEDPR